MWTRGRGTRLHEAAKALGQAPGDVLGGPRGRPVGEARPLASHLHLHWHLQQLWPCGAASYAVLTDLCTLRPLSTLCFFLCTTPACFVSSRIAPEDRPPASRTYHPAFKPCSTAPTPTHDQETSGAGSLDNITLHWIAPFTTLESSPASGLHACPCSDQNPIGRTVCHLRRW